MLKNPLTLLVMAILLALPAPMTISPAKAESSFANFMRGGQPRVRHNNQYMSDKSPIPRETVRSDLPANTILVDTKERRLYYGLGNGKAIKYAVGVGREGFEWSGSHKISRKAEWPGWTPPQVMRDRVKRQEGRVLPAFMPGGPTNPLGARAMYIGSTIYRIHGTNQPWTIGKAMSSGCIRMANEDVIDLYERAGVGTKVTVRH